MRQGCPHLSFLANIVLEVLVRAMWQEREIKASKLEERNVVGFVDVMIICVQTLKSPQKIVLWLLHEFSRTQKIPRNLFCLFKVLLIT